jgi:arylsulfatase A-like enzyme
VSRAAALVGVLLVARLLGLAGRDLPASVWLPSVLVWHDVATGLVFWVCATAIGRALPVSIAYWAIVVWAALNVAVMRALSSPLTVPMLRAADGPLRDSIAYYVTPRNVAVMAAVLAAGAILPRLKMPPQVRTAAFVAAVALALPGPFVTVFADVRGAERNAVSALVISMLPLGAAPRASDDTQWRRSPFGAPPADDLSRFAGAGSGMNVLVVVLESAGARYLRPYGAADDPMPTLTALTSQALRFESAYAVYPESIKGLFSVLCSRSPEFGVAVERLLTTPCAPLAGVFRDAGYETALFHSGRFSYLGMDALLAGQAFDTFEDAGAIGGQVESSFGVDEESTVARILSWLDDRAARAGSREGAQPFFTIYLPAAGHHPYVTPRSGPFDGEGELSAYKNALRYADESFALLLAGLRARELDERTLIMVFGDHGEAFGQHDGNYGHSLFVYDENVRVPLVVSVPGVTTEATAARQVASLIDVAPTLLDLVGLPVPASHRGRSLLAGASLMAGFFTDYGVRWAGLRDGCWKYILEVDTGRSELYDVCRDPDETINLAGIHPERVRTYRSRVAETAGTSDGSGPSGVGRRDQAARIGAAYSTENRIARPARRSPLAASTRSR